MRESPKVPTIVDVARLAGVSPMTVSRTINRNGPVSDRARAAVEQAIAQLGYRPSAAARALVSGGEDRIVLLHRSSTTSAYLGELLLGGIEVASKAQLHMIVEAFSSEAGPDEIVRVVHHARAAGVLLPPPFCDWTDLIDALTNMGIPSVAIAANSPGDAVRCVSVDDGEAAHAMTRHLIALGHRHIGFIQGHSSHKSSARRLGGYRRALRDCGIADEAALVVPGDFTYRSGLDAAEKLLQLEQPPTAIFACNDDMAAAVIAAAHQRRIDVPGQLSVCGFDDTPLASAIWPTLTTVHQPIKAMAQEAVKLLIGAIRSAAEDGPRQVRLPCDLVIRESDAAPVRQAA